MRFQVRENTIMKLARQTVTKYITYEVLENRKHHHEVFRTKNFYLIFQRKECTPLSFWIDKQLLIVYEIKYTSPIHGKIFVSEEIINLMEYIRRLSLVMKDIWLEYCSKVYNGETNKISKMAHMYKD